MEIESSVETSARTSRVWVYGDGNDTNAVSGDDLGAGAATDVLGVDMAAR